MLRSAKKFPGALPPPDPRQAVAPNCNPHPGIISCRAFPSSLAAQRRPKSTSISRPGLRFSPVRSCAVRPLEDNAAPSSSSASAPLIRPNDGFPRCADSVPLLSAKRLAMRSRWRWRGGWQNHRRACSPSAAVGSSTSTGILPLPVDAGAVNRTAPRFRHRIELRSSTFCESSSRVVEVLDFDRMPLAPALFEGRPRHLFGIPHRLGRRTPPGVHIIDDRHARRADGCGLLRSSLA